jgi:hypothetical protein
MSDRCGVRHFRSFTALSAVRKIENEVFVVTNNMGLHVNRRVLSPSSYCGLLSQESPDYFQLQCNRNLRKIIYDYKVVSCTPKVCNILRLRRDLCHCISMLLISTCRWIGAPFKLATPVETRRFQKLRVISSAA